MEVKKVVVTAFEPFDNREINASLEVVNDLNCNNSTIEKLIVPVSWKNSFDKIEEKLNQNIDYLILCGEAVSRMNITIELLAVNYMHASITDNDGIKFLNTKIDDGNDAYFSNVNVYELINKVNNELKFDGINHEIKLSLSAGSYLCNYIYYKSIRKIIEQNLNTKVIFVHFPLINNNINKQLFPIILKKIIKNMEV